MSTSKGSFQLEYRGKPTRSALILQYAKEHPGASPQEIAKALRKKQVSAGYAAKVLKHFASELPVSEVAAKAATRRKKVTRQKSAPRPTTAMANIPRLQAARDYVDKHCDGSHDAAAESISLLAELRTPAD